MKFTSEMVDDLANKLLIGLSEEENDLVLDFFSLSRICNSPPRRV